MCRPNSIFVQSILLAVALSPVLAQPLTDCEGIVSLVAPDISLNGSGNHQFAEMTPDGRFVLVRNIVSEIGNPVISEFELILYDRENEITESIELRTNLEFSGQSFGGGYSLSADARFIVFASNNIELPNNNGMSQIYLFDRVTETIEHVSKTSVGEASNAPADTPDVSDDGRFVAFSSAATNLVAQPTGGFNNIYLFDRVQNQMTLASAGENGTAPNDDALPGFGPAPRQVIISAGGQYICYVSAADNLVGAAQISPIASQLYLYNRITGDNEIVSLSDSGHPFFRNVADPEPSFTIQIFRPVQYDMSPDARYFSFDANFSNPEGPSTPTALTSVYVRDRTLQVTEEIDYGTTTVRDFALSPSISDNGRYVTFSTSLLGLSPLEFDEFTFVINQYRYDRVNDTLQFIADNGTGSSPNDRTLGVFCSISGDGGTIVFPSRATNLLSNQITAGPLRTFIRIFDDDPATVDCNNNAISDYCEGRGDPSQFVNALVDGDTSNCIFDINGDGFTNAIDIQALVSELISP